jgi:fumarate reductase flavoprotein subunit
MTLLSFASARPEIETDVLVIGAGAAGLVAALSAREGGAEVVMLERDPLPRGSTALSSGLVAAAGTRLQQEAGVHDTPALLAADIQAKCGGLADPAIVDALCEVIGPTIDWLCAEHRVPFVLVDGFSYPGQSVRRMHGLPQRTGAEMMDHLHAAAERAGVEIVTSALVDALYRDDDGRMRGVRLRRPDGTTEDVGCRSLVLACSGFGGNAEMVRQHIPGMTAAVFLGHQGNQGHAMQWGEALGARLQHMGAFQGHGSVAVPYNIGITWALMVSGAIQVNRLGQRFANEHRGYSEQAADVLRQPGAIAFDIYDERCQRVALGFDHYREAVKAGAIRTAASAGELEQLLGLPAGALVETLGQVERFAAGAPDPLGRDFTTQPPLAPPYYAVRVTGGLYHTQGGLAVDGEGRVLGADGPVAPNLFAAGGAACGVSGPADWGYLAGNGLLAAIGLGRLAGSAAARASQPGRPAT